MWPRVRYVLLMIALCAIGTCPAAHRSCTAKNRAREADELLTYLADRVGLVIAATGKVPSAEAGPTPGTSCCDQGGTCSPDPAAWAVPGWQALAFSIDDAHRYTYSYVPDPGGRAAVIRAIGDVDCDGIAAELEIAIRVEPSGVTRTWNRKNPFE